MYQIRILPCLDSDELAAQRRNELALRPELAESLGRSAVEAIELGYDLTDDGKVESSKALWSACESKVSIAPEAELPIVEKSRVNVTNVQVTNETTLGASRRLVDSGKRPLALNNANGTEIGGGFLRGATAQEEALCRSSGLYATLVDDPLYTFHRKHKLRTEASDWAMLSPNVPVFRDDRGIELDVPWLVSFLTCAAPYAPSVGHPRSGDLFEQRIARVLSIAQAYGYSELVLGAWGAAHSATMLGARPVTSAARSRGNSQVCLVKWLLRSPIGLPSDVSLDRFVMRSRIE